MSLLLALVGGEAPVEVPEVKRSPFWLPIGSVEDDFKRKKKLEKELEDRVKAIYERINGIVPTRKAVKTDVTEVKRESQKAVFLFRKKELAAPNVYKELEAGSRAEALLRDEAYQTAVRSVREGIHLRWAESPVSDVEGQHELRLMLKLLDDLEKNIEQAVSSGKIAAVQEKELEKRKKKR